MTKSLRSLSEAQKHAIVVRRLYLGNPENGGLGGLGYLGARDYTASQRRAKRAGGDVAIRKSLIESGLLKPIKEIWMCGNGHESDGPGLCHCGLFPKKIEKTPST